MHGIGFICQVVSAVLGMIGTTLLFFFSYSFEPFSGGVLGSPQIAARNELVRASNLRRKRWQLIGLAILWSSFVVQVIAIFLST